MATEPDIIARIEADFSPTDSPIALRLLNDSGRTGRLARCIVFAASGDLGQLRRYIAMADEDFRDVIMAGEYEEPGGQVRDLRVSFLIDAPEKWWIAEFAVEMERRGYALRSLDSRPAKVGPFEYVADQGEGVAEFCGEGGSFTVKKADRQWSLRGDPGVLESYDLHVPFDEESAFRDAVSGYLLTK